MCVSFEFVSRRTARLENFSFGICIVMLRSIPDEDFSLVSPKCWFRIAALGGPEKIIDDVKPFCRF